MAGQASKEKKEVTNMADKLTRADLMALEKEFLTPAQVCAVVGGDPQWLRLTAHEAPQELGFPVVVIHRRVKIPRIPFCRFMGWL